MSRQTCNWVVCSWIALWVCLSVTIIIVNKHILFYTDFKYPFALALWHMLLASCVSKGCMWAGNVKDAYNELGSKMVHAQLAVIGVLFAAVLVTGNAALLFLTVPTVQMLKAAGPVTIYLMGMAMATETFESMKALKVLVVCTGVAIASYGDVTLSAIGFVLQVSSIMMDATRCCYLQKVLQLADVKVTPLMTLSHVAPFSAAALFVPTVFMEGPKLMNTLDSWWSALPLVLFSGVLASALNLVIFKIISLTSALSTSLSGVIKEWACILVAMFVYNTHVTYLQWFGYSIAIAGLLWYQLGKAKLPGGGTPLGGKPLTVSRSGSNWAAAVKESLPVYLVYANQVQQLRDGASATEDGAFGKANKQSQ